MANLLPVAVNLSFFRLLNVEILLFNTIIVTLQS